MSLLAEQADWFTGQKLLLCNSKGLPMRETEISQMFTGDSFRTSDLGGELFREIKPGIAKCGPFLVFPADSPAGVGGIRRIRASKAIQRLTVVFTGTRAPCLRSLRRLERFAESVGK